ncbi:MAG: hypothetical protein KGJ62_02190 [Armatimonadetes bacterium]|nr:hypothetical protein [Armatimonadota bacterium]MDE2206113.1 hypothetical protein [Armatimonadota bacterium]
MATLPEGPWPGNMVAVNRWSITTVAVFPCKINAAIVVTECGLFTLFIPPSKCFCTCARVLTWPPGSVTEYAGARCHITPFMLRAAIAAFCAL